ncbi:hypothetical protein V1477_005299, partial [Vespula maculifrons]
MRTESRIRTETCNNKTRNLAPLKFPLVRGIAKSGYYVIDFQEFPNGTYSNIQLVIFIMYFPGGDTPGKRERTDRRRKENIGLIVDSQQPETTSKSDMGVIDDDWDDDWDHDWDDISLIKTSPLGLWIVYEFNSSAMHFTR